jgi:hypothetical protein
LVRVPRTSEKQYWPPVLRTITRVQRTNFCGMFQIHQRLHPVCGTKAAFVAAASTPLIGTLVGSTVLDSCFRVTPCAWSKVQCLPDGRIAAAGCIPVRSRERSTTLPLSSTSVGYIFWESVAGHGTAEAFSWAAGSCPPLSGPRPHRTIYLHSHGSETKV